MTSREASDLGTVRPLRPTLDYFLDAAAGVRANKELYAGAEANGEA